MNITSRRRAFPLLLLLVAVTVSAVSAAGCAAGKPEPEADGQHQSKLEAGGLYSIDYGDGSFRVVKILVLDDDAAHVAMYPNKFSARPTAVDPASLSFDSGDDENEDIGIMHLPLSREAFLRDRPAFISRAPVTEEDLEGYRMWKEAGGELFR